MANQKLSLGISITADVKQAQAELNKLQSSLRDLITRSGRSDMNVTKEMKEAAAAAKELQLHMAQAMNPKTGTLELDKLNMSLKASGKTLTDFSQKMLRGGEEGQKAFSNLAKTITSTQAPTARLGGMVEELATTFKTALKYQVSYGAINAVTNGIREAVNYAKDLNGTLNDIRIVTGKSADEADRLAKNAQKAAKNLSTSANDLLQAQLIYFQQGDSEAMASMKGEITTKAAKVAGVEAQQMSEYLTAVWNSYKVGSGELELFVDKLAAVGAATATSLEEISTAMTKVAATANTVGVSYDQLTATIATISSVTRTSAESVGTAMKTIYARMGDLKIGKKDEDGLALGSVSEQLKAVGIEILDENKNLRDMGIVVEEVGEKWQGWTEAQRTAVAQAIAGKRQYTQLMALFENWDMYTETKGVSEGASGALEDQFKIWSDSWEAASNRVKVATEGMYSNLLNDDVMIKFTDTLAYAVNLLDTVLDSLGGIPGILALVASQILRIKGVAIEETFADMKRNLSLMIFPNKTMSHFEQIKGTFKQLKVDMNFDELQPSMQGYVNKLSDINTLQATLAKHSNNLTTVQKLGFEQQIEMVNQLHISLEETLQTIDKMDLELQKLSQANNLNLSKADREMIMRSNQGPIIKNSGLQGLSLLDNKGGKVQNIEKFVNTNRTVEYYKQLALQGNNVKNVQLQLKQVFGETSPVVQRLNADLEKGATQGKAMELAFNLLSGESSEISIALDLLGINFKELRTKIVEAIPEADTLFKQIENGAQKTSPMVEKLGKNIEDAAKKNKGGWSHTGMGLMNMASSAMSASSAVSTLFDTFEDGKASIEETIQSVASATMSVGMIAIQAFSTGNVYLGIAVAAIGLISGVVTGISRAHKTTKEQLEETNRKIEETENNINSLTQEIEKLQKKRNDAAGIINTNLDNEIERLREIIRLEKERLGLEEDKVENLTREDMYFKAQSYTFQSQGTQNIPKLQLENGKYINYTQFFKGDQEKSKQLIDPETGDWRKDISVEHKKGEYILYAGGKQIATTSASESSVYVPDTTYYANQNTTKVKEAILAAINLSKENSATNKLDYNIAINEAITDLSNTFGKYGADRNQYGEAAREAIVSNLDSIMKELPEGADANEFLLSNLFKITPDAFTSVENFKSLYGELLNKIQISEKDIDELWKNYNLEQNAATLNAKKFNSTISDIKGIVNIASNALKELKENSGKLDASTIMELEDSWTILGDSAKVYSDRLWEAQGNQKAMNEIIQQATKETIQAKIATGDYIGQSEAKIASELKDLGVTNANAVAKKVLAEAEQRATLETIDFNKTLKDGAIDFSILATQTGIAEEAIVEYYIQEKIINNSELNMTQKIAALNQVASAALNAALQTSGLASALASLGSLSDLTTTKGKNLNDIMDAAASTEYTFNQTEAEKLTALGISTTQFEKRTGFLGLGGTAQFYKVKAGDIQSVVKQLYAEGQTKMAEELLKQSNAIIANIKTPVTSNFGGTTDDSSDKKTAKEILEERYDELKSGYENRTKRAFWEKTGVNEKGEDVFGTIYRIPLIEDLTEQLSKMRESGEFTQTELEDNFQDIFALYDKAIELKKKEDSLGQDLLKVYSDTSVGDHRLLSQGLTNVRDSLYRFWQYKDSQAKAGTPLSWEDEVKWKETILKDYENIDKDFQNAMKNYETSAKSYMERAEFYGYGEDDNQYAAQKRLYEQRLTPLYLEQISQQKIALDEMVRDGIISAETRVKIEKQIAEDFYEWKANQELELAKIQQKMIEDAVDYEYDKWKEDMDRRKAELEGKKTIYSKNYEITNSVADAQHELNKELQASLTMYQYLDENTRKLLFNTEEYVALNAELENIEAQANRLKLNYLADIEGKTEAEIENLTTQYEIQTENLMKQYEIKKAEFEIEKKRLALNNTLNERNTRMFMNGQWQWVANAKAVAEAQTELAEAEYQKSKLETEQWQQNTLNMFTETVSNLNLEAANVEKSFSNLKDKLDGKEGLADTIEKVGGRITSAGQSLIDWAKNSLNSSIETEDVVVHTGTVVTVAGPGNTLNTITRPSANPTSKKYAAGTDNAQGGISSVNEKGIEMWATKYGHMVELNPGDKIFNHDQFDFLYKFSRNPEQYLRNINTNSAQAIDNRITIGGIEISGDSAEGEALHSILTRILGNH